VDEDEARRTSWREVEIAVQYDRARPGYPPEAVAFALAAGPTCVPPTSVPGPGS
jgi:hypothetical protein